MAQRRADWARLAEYGSSIFGRRLSGGRSPARPLQPVLGRAMKETLY
jgi:hypothetical protein